MPAAPMNTPPSIQLNGATEPTTMNPQPSVQNFGEPARPAEPDTTNVCADLKRELISQQTKYEISELSSPTALRRFGAPFRSDAGEVAPEDSELPLLRYIFVNHIRNFPFLDKAKEKEFWQDKLQVVRCLRSYWPGDG
jgi:hypothetical protein